MGKVAAVPIVAMLMTECAQAGVMILSKQAMSAGMNKLIFIAYSNSLAAIILLPISFAFHRSGRPPLTLSIIGWFFLLSVIGFISQIIGYAGLNYSSPTLGTAMLNLLPAFTFILAVIFRMEKIDWRSSSSVAKILGTIVSISGAFVVTLYKGPALLNASSTDVMSHNQLLSQQSNWIIGGILLLAYVLLASGWIILQAYVLKKYPAELVMVFYFCFFVAIQSVAVSLFVEGDPRAWSLTPKMRLIGVVYSAVFGSTFTVSVTTWCVRKVGPVFIAMFKPLGVVVAVSVGVTLVGDTFYLGSLIGAVVIVIGFYSLMWGKANEEKMGGVGEATSLASSKQRVPLLQKKIEEI